MIRILFSLLFFFISKPALSYAHNTISGIDLKDSYISKKIELAKGPCKQLESYTYVLKKVNAFSLQYSIINTKPSDVIILDGLTMASIYLSSREGVLNSGCIFNKEIDSISLWVEYDDYTWQTYVLHIHNEDCTEHKDYCKYGDRIMMDGFFSNERAEDYSIDDDEMKDGYLYIDEYLQNDLSRALNETGQKFK